MFTKQAPSIANSLVQSGMPTQQAASVNSLLGQCRAPLEHRGPVKFDYTRPSMRQIDQGAIFPPGLSPLSFPELGLPPQDFPPTGGEPPTDQEPPESDLPQRPDPPSDFAPPEDGQPEPPDDWPMLAGNAVWMGGDNVHINIRPFIFNGFSFFQFLLPGARRQTVVTDVFIDEYERLVVRKKQVFVLTGKNENPGEYDEYLARFKEIRRVTDVYEDASALIQQRADLKVMVLYPNDGEDELSPETIIEITDCSTPP